jgi:hypothetical protein
MAAGGLIGLVYGLVAVAALSFVWLVFAAGMAICALIIAIAGRLSRLSLRLRHLVYRP